MKEPKGPSPNPEDPADMVTIEQYNSMKTSRNKHQVFFAIAAAFSIAVIMLYMVIVSHYNEIKATNVALNAQMKQITDSYAELKAKHDELKKQKAKYEEVQELLHQLEVQNMKDMSDYIQARYSKVPLELAELIAKTTHDKCIEYGADFATVVGIMEVESAFNPFAVSHAGARGLMQVLPKVWLEPLGIADKTDLHDISLGIDSGIRVYLQYLKEQKGDIKRTLNQYNGCSLDKGPYAPQIFEAIGRFTAYRNNSYTGTIDQEQGEQTEEKEENDRPSKNIPN